VKVVERKGRSAVVVRSSVGVLPLIRRRRRRRRGARVIRGAARRRAKPLRAVISLQTPFALLARRSYCQTFESDLDQQQAASPLFERRE
jgi:hypothetical protein